MSQPAVPNQFEIISDKLVALADDVDTGVDDRYPPPTQQDSYPQPALAWMGPVAFARAYESVRGIDYDFGSFWGPNGDQRVGLSVEGDADAGLLYAYDPTWDEYAVLGSDLPLVAIEDAFAPPLRGVEHPALEDFIALLPTVPAARPSPGPES